VTGEELRKLAQPHTLAGEHPWTDCSPAIQAQWEALAADIVSLMAHRPQPSGIAMHLASQQSAQLQQAQWWGENMQRFVSSSDWATKRATHVAAKPTPASEPVDIPCPTCRHYRNRWSIEAYGQCSSCSFEGR
jgi:hypothetical protein